MTSPTQHDWFNQAQPRHSVPGYLNDAPARVVSSLLTQQAAQGLRGALAEIGVFYGNLFVGLARASNPGEVCVGLDPFEYPGKANFKDEFLAILDAHTDEAQRGRARIIDKTSDEITVPDWCAAIETPLRFAHLDGNHTRNSVLTDIALATSWLAPGAVIVFDDIFNELHPDVTVGIIDGLRATAKVAPIAIIPRLGSLYGGGAKLVCCTPGSEKDYVAAMDEAIQLRPGIDHFMGRRLRTYWPPKG